MATNKRTKLHEAHELVHGEKEDAPAPAGSQRPNAIMGNVMPVSPPCPNCGSIFCLDTNGNGGLARRCGAPL